MSTTPRAKYAETFLDLPVILEKRPTFNETLWHTTLFWRLTLENNQRRVRMTNSLNRYFQLQKHNPSDELRTLCRTVFNLGNLKIYGCWSWRGFLVLGRSHLQCLFSAPGYCSNPAVVYSGSSWEQTTDSCKHCCFSIIQLQSFSECYIIKKHLESFKKSKKT